MMSLSFVIGTEPDKWLHRFDDRTQHGGIHSAASHDPVTQLLEGSVDIALVRLPDSRIDGSADLHVVRLYQESMGIALPKEHTLTLLDKLSDADLEGEICNYRIGEALELDIDELRSALQVVAANVGYAIAPRPLIKAMSGKLIEHRDFTSPTHVGQTSIALAWKKDRDAEDIQDFVGIAKGRKPNSSRQSGEKKLSAREKSLAKQQRREADRKAKGQRPKVGRKTKPRGRR
ncbi:LysR family transcriptional regulator [Corynebacterium ulcerans]|uniref:LysR family transcriptional regulator substrate-binding protein n=1 Tax=Corynebacterium ulcerans TaxID=65058 RepID=UPI000C7729E7|nr:LysR family transcriptional regulator substrate-binding protein [Corynebacterium ulcerans]MBH5301971.1 LysR family transcriptional regulator substrate-binding protein [Corynebacterium ulcerans]PLV99499.1 LysR family transcriptional regulator [Corynebacterium ulcerans]